VVRKACPGTPQKLWKRPNSASVLSICFSPSILLSILVVYKPDWHILDHRHNSKQLGYHKRVSVAIAISVSITSRIDSKDRTDTAWLGASSAYQDLR
jgi:hypothetical protein